MIEDYKNKIQALEFLIQVIQNDLVQCTKQRDELECRFKSITNELLVYKNILNR